MLTQHKHQRKTCVTNEPINRRFVCLCDGKHLVMKAKLLNKNILPINQISNMALSADSQLPKLLSNSEKSSFYRFIIN